jgi:hypothetical protein
VTMSRRMFATSGLAAWAVLSIPKWAGARATGPACPSMFCDGDGLIVHKGMDGGDTAQREGWYWFGVWIRQNVLNDPWPIARQLTFPGVLQLLEPKSDGVFYRHPKLPPWNDPYSKEFGFSRDQMIPLVAAMGSCGTSDCIKRLRELWNALPQDPLGGTKHTFNGEWKTVNLFGHEYKTVYTGDVVLPATIDLFRRAWNEDPIRATDGNGPGGQIDLATNVELRLASANDKDDTGDDLNLIVMLLMSLLRFPVTKTDPRYPTTAELVSRYKGRPLSYGSYLGAYRQKYGIDLNASPTEVRRRMDDGIKNHWQPDASGVYGAVRWYHREEAGANPKLAELYRPIIRRYFEDPNEMRADVS